VALAGIPLRTAYVHCHFAEAAMFRLLVTVVLSLIAVSPVGADTAREHPVLPALRLAYARLDAIEQQVSDYTCVLVKRELVGGRISAPQQMFVKLREEQVRGGRVVVPFSVYMRFLGPTDLKGREVLYVRGRNQGKIIAKKGGQRFAYFTTAIAPTSDLAMDGHRYPITEIGLRNLIGRLIEDGREVLSHPECKVNYYVGAKINGRECTVIEVRHPVRRPGYRFQFARIFVDDQRQIPVRYAAYDWPAEQGGQPRLIEEYTYLDLKLNVGLSNWDFDHRNESYGFRKDYDPNRPPKR
jgi:hypothetical protein